MARQPLTRARARTGVATALVAGALAGCSHGLLPLVRPLPAALPPGSPLREPTLAIGDAWLRHHLVFGQPDTALALFAPDREPPAADALLASLQQALVLRETGALERSNELLEWADQEADRRRVRSASRTAASFLISDRVLEYTPSAGERVLIPFYRMLNYLELGDAEAAAVEARRASALLEGEGGGGRCGAAGMVQYLAGLTFEAAGEGADAAVSLRQAEATFSACEGAAVADPPPGFSRDLVRIAAAAGLAEVADSARARYGDTSGEDALKPADGSAEVIVLIERGFVAHRTAEAVHVPVFDEELDGLDTDDADAIALRAAAIAARLTGNLAEREVWGSSWDDRPDARFDQALAGAHILKLSWPGIASPRRASTPARILVGERLTDPATVADLSNLADAELSAERPAVLARLVARSVTRYLVAREIERKAEDRGGELLGFLAGRAVNFAANEMERPDTRSWTLLPDRIAIARVSVEPGERTLWLETGDEEGGSTRTAVGTLSLRPGERRIVAVRAYGTGRPETDAAAGR